jgi:hypothetical protein
MATFSFGRDINIHWNGFDVRGPSGTVFSIPDQLYEEFESDIRDVEPSLTWIDINEFQTLKDSVPTGGYVGSAIGVSPISVATSSNTATISLNSTTALNGYLLAADGSGGTIWTPASTSSLTSVIGIDPISTVISGGTVSVSLTANYQTAGSYQPAGTYVTGVVGTSPISASGTTAITVGIDQSAITAGNASSAQATVYLVRNNTASTILKGTLVSATGAEPSGRIDIAPFSVTGLQDSELRVMGIATENIGVGVNGIVMSFGTLTGLDTTGTAESALAVGDEDWDEGTILYAHPTVPGKLTEVRPQHDLAIAFTTVRHASTGQIAIRIVPGNFHLEWMHDVSVGGVSTALPLVYNSTSSVWIAQELTSVGIADNAIVAAKIASGAVGSAAIAANAVVLGDIAAGAVDSSALADNSVVAAKIAAAAVGTAAISSGAASSGLVLASDGIGGVAFTTAAAGFNGPVSSIDETITRFDGTDGKTVQGSSVVIDDSNDVFFPAAIAHSPVSVSLATNTYTLDLSAGNYFTGVTAGTRIAPTFVSSASTSFAAATSGTLTLPSGIQANDIVVALIGSDEGSAISASSNRWTLVTRIKGGTGFANGAIFQATITSSAETSIGTFTGLVTSSNGISYAFRNCGGYARIATSTGSTGMPDAPALTAEFSNTVILAIGFLDDDAVLPTAPAGYVNFASQTSASGFTTMVAMNTITAGGSQNPAAFGGSGNDDWAAATMEMYGSLGTRSVVLSNPPDKAISGYLNAKAHTVVISYTGVAEGTLSWDSKITWAANATPPGSSDALVVLTSNDGVTYRGNYTAY